MKTAPVQIETAQRLRMRLLGRAADAVSRSGAWMTRDWLKLKLERPGLVARDPGSKLGFTMQMPQALRTDIGTCDCVLLLKFSTSSQALSFYNRLHHALAVVIITEFCHEPSILAWQPRIDRRTVPRADDCAEVPVLHRWQCSTTSIGLMR